MLEEVTTIDVKRVIAWQVGEERLALLKILAMSNQDVANGKIKPVADIVARLRAKR
jgi:hypothetical protein